MKINKMKYLFLAAATLTGLAACSNSTTKSNDEKSDQTNFKITTVRWSDWGEEYHKGFIDVLLKKLALKSAGILLLLQTGQIKNLY